MTLSIEYGDCVGLVKVNISPVVLAKPTEEVELNVLDIKYILPLLILNISAVNAGLLYNANSYLIISGDGKGANAVFTTNANGSIVSVNIIESGIGYTFAPTVTANGSNSVSATFTATISYAGDTSGNVYVTKIRS